MYIIQEGKKMPGQEPMKNKPTLLLCANVSGDLKIKTFCLIILKPLESLENIKSWKVG